MPASLYNSQSQIHQSVGGYNSSEINMDQVGGGIMDNRNGTGMWRFSPWLHILPFWLKIDHKLLSNSQIYYSTLIGGSSEDRSAAEQLALQLAYLQGGGNSNSHSSAQSNSISASNHLNINQSHSCNNTNSNVSGLHHQQPATPPGGCSHNGLSNGMGTPNHTNLAPFSDISGMSSGAGDLLSASVGLGNGGSLLNGNDIL